MKLGTENRNKVIAAAALIAVAVVLMATRFSGFLGLGSSSAAAPQPTTVATDIPPDRPAARGGAARDPRGGFKKLNPAQSLDPTLRKDLLRSSEETKYEGTGRNIFKVFVEPPPKVIVPPVVAQPVVPAAPPPPPPPPPIELKYYGYATPQGGSKRIFLAHNEDVFIAKEGEIVNRRYKVIRISPNSVEILDVLSNNRQSIPLTQG
ncbi:MAG: hypothetical protein J2P13_12810 [Acidobacteria bacterium]|nr:hypothetical protein [Acidobacteriota bacterium]